MRGVYPALRCWDVSRKHCVPLGLAGRKRGGDVEQWRNRVVRVLGNIQHFWLKKLGAIPGYPSRISSFMNWMRQLKTDYVGPK